MEWSYALTSLPILNTETLGYGNWKYDIVYPLWVPILPTATLTGYVRVAIFPTATLTGYVRVTIFPTATLTGFVRVPIFPTATFTGCVGRIKHNILL